MLTHIVEGVAVLNLNGAPKIRHFFDCAILSGNVNSLRWERSMGVQRFPVTFEIVNNDGLTFMARRMDLAPPSGAHADFGDLGVYTCQDDRQSVSVNISGGKRLNS